MKCARLVPADAAIPCACLACQLLCVVQATPEHPVCVHVRVCMCVSSQLQWDVSNTTYALPPMHTINLDSRCEFTPALLAHMSQCVTSAEAVSGTWAMGQLPEPGLRVPWRTTRLLMLLELEPFLQLAERVCDHTWAIQDLNIALRAQQVTDICLHGHGQQES